MADDKPDESGNKELFKAMVGNLSRVVSNQTKQTKQLENIEKAVQDSGGSSDDDEGGAEQIFEENIADKAAANEQSKQTGFLAGLFKKSEEKKDEGGFFGFIKKHWGKLLIALALLLTPLKDLGKAFLTIKDYFANNSWGDIGTDIGLGLLAALGLKVAGGLLFAKISSMIMAALMPAGAALPGGVPAAGTLGTAFVKAIPILGLVVGIGLAIKDALTAVDLKDEWKVDGMSAAIGGFLGGTSEGWKGAFRTGGRWAITGASAGFLMGGPVGAAIGGIGGLVIGGLLGFIGGKKIAQWINAAGKTIKKVFDKLPEIIKSVTDKLAEWGNIASDGLIGIIRKIPGMGDFGETSAERKKIEDEDAVGGGGEAGQKRRKKKLKTLKKKEEGGAAHYESLEKKLEMVQSELDKMETASMSKKGAAAFGGEGKLGALMGKKRAQKIRLMDQIEAQKSGTPAAPATPATPATPAAPAARVAPKGAVHSPGASSRAKKKIAKAKARRSGKSSKEHSDVKVSQADMSGVDWNKFGGRDTIEGIILSTWNEAGLTKPPTFTSGFRSKDHKLSKKNPNSQHIQKTAFDLRSKDLSSTEAPGIFATLMSAFGPMGIWGQHETKGVNVENRSGEHFHFQLAAKGFSGTVDKATGFIAGEDGPERVDIVPLNDPSARMNAMNQVHNDRMASQGGTPSINVVTSSQVNNSSDQSAVLIPANVRPKEIPA